MIGLATFALLLPLWTPTMAQSGQLSNPTEKNFKICDLTSRQGLVTISTKYQVVLEFPGQIEEISANRGEIMKISPDKPELIKNRLYIDAQKPNGVSDLNVVVDGETLMFRLTAENNSYNGIRKYSVAACNTAPPRTPSNAATGGTNRNTTANSTSTSSSTSSAVKNPRWLIINLDTSVDASGQGVLRYELVNSGPNGVYAAGSGIELWGGLNQNTPYQVNAELKNATTGLVAPKAKQAGLILIPGVAQHGDLHLHWVVRDAKTNSTYTLDKAIDAKVFAATKRTTLPILAYYGLGLVV